MSPRPQTYGVYARRGRTLQESIAAGILGIAGWRLRFVGALVRHRARPLGVPRLLSLVLPRSHELCASRPQLSFVGGA